MMNPLAVIESRISEIRALGARRIGIFGSFARGQARDDLPRADESRPVGADLDLAAEAP
jgi:predicted nucleotidyltransferase